MKSCPDDKVYNPATGRCVSKTGAIGKKLLKEKPPSIPSHKKVDVKMWINKDINHKQEYIDYIKIHNPDIYQQYLKDNIIRIDLSNASPAPPAPKAKVKECPSGKVLNPATNRCIKIKEQKNKKQSVEPIAPIEPKPKPAAPPDDFYYDRKEYDKLTKEEIKLKNSLPVFISKSFIYNIDVLLDDIKNKGHSFNTIIHRLKSIINDLEDIQDEVLTDREQRTAAQKLKFKDFIDYNTNRLKIVKDYYNEIIKNKNKPSKPIISEPIVSEPIISEPIVSEPVIVNNLSLNSFMTEMKKKYVDSDDESDNESIISEKSDISDIYDMPKKKKKIIKSSISSKFKLLFRNNKASILDRINYYIYIKSLYLKIKNKLQYCKSEDIILDKAIGDKSFFGSIYIAHFKNKLGKFSIKTMKKKDHIKLFLDIEVKLQEELTRYVVDFKTIHFPITYGTLFCPRPKQVYQLNELANGSLLGFYNDYINSVNKLSLLNYNNFTKALTNKNDIVKKYQNFYDIIKDFKNDNNAYRTMKKIYNLHYIYGKDNYPNLDRQLNIIKNLMAQALISILTFNTYTKYMHNDAHNGNFLYHKVNEGGFFHYKINSVDYYLENLGYIVVIWDFGLSISFSKKKESIYTDIERVSNINSQIPFFNGSLNSMLEFEPIPDNQDKNINFYGYVVMSILKYLKSNDMITTVKPDNIINSKPFIINNH